MMDISVIMPCYNSAQTINQTLNSILEQKTKYNFEIVIIDDGSSDNTVDIVKRQMDSHPNIRLFFQKHKFQAEARNLGIAKATGKYLMFSDADDLYRPRFIETMGDLIQTNQLVIAGIEKQFSSGTTEIENHSILQTVHNQVELIGDYLTKNQEMDVGLWNKIFVKEIITQNQLKMNNKNFFEDSLFVLQYLSVIDYQKIEYTNLIGYTLFKHVGSTTNAFDSQLLEKCDFYIDKVAKIIQKTPAIEQYFNAFKARIYLFYVHRSIVNNPSWSSTEQKNILKRVLKLNTFQHLSLKYSIAILFAYLMPQKYIDLYRNRG